MFAFHRSPIGQVALILGCITALAATSVQAQDAGADAGAPANDAAPPVEDVAVPEVPIVDAPTTEAQLPEAPVTNLEPGADPQTGVRGRIVDSKSGLGLEMAPVLIVDRERTRSAITITNGAYELTVPPGVYTVRSFYDMHHGARLANVRVTRGRFTEVNLLLDPIDEVEEIEVEEIEVAYRADTTTAAAQDAIRMESSGIGEGMGAQQMSQSGASDAGSAAKRVVGVTVEGSSLVIRGLGGRYARVYMNGVPLPSTDPDSPSVDLDLFPTNIIDSMTVSKTFLPDMPADFAGGVLEIATVTFPREFTLKLGVSGEYASMTTLRDRLDYNGGSYDVLGFDDGDRALPDALPPTLFSPGRRVSDEDLAVMRSFNNTWQYRQQTGAPNVRATATLGDSIDLGGGARFGYLLTNLYSHRDRRTTGKFLKLIADGPDDGTSPDVFSRYDDVQNGSEEVQLASVGTVSLDLGADHSFTLLSMYNRSAVDATSYRSGVDAELGTGAKVERWQLQYTARRLWFNQLLGDHRNLAGTRLRLRWNAFHSVSGREDPDRRVVTRSDDDNNVGLFQLRSNGASRIYQDLDGADGGGNASLRFPLWDEGWGTVGGGARFTERDFTTRRFMFPYTQSSGEAVDYAAPIEQVLGGDGIGTLVNLVEATNATDSFVAEQAVFTGYAMVETPLVGPLSLATGARAEIYKQDLTTSSPFPPAEGDPPPIVNDRTDVNVLPAASLKYELSDTMLLRAAYGMTVGRPQARELASFVFFDFVRDRNIVGNAELRTTLIHNVDLRWEWFFDEAQVIAASLFFKDFRRPIEQYLGPMGTATAFGNAASATNFGAELELRTSLKRVASGLRNFEFGANLTLVHSRVEPTAEQTEATAPGARRMFGQAPYVINVSLRFADPVTKASLGAVYNLVGPRITDVGSRQGTYVLPNVEDQPVHSVDLVGGWNVGDHLSLKLKWVNVLFQARRLVQGGVEIQRTNPGTFVSLGLDYSY